MRSRTQGLDQSALTTPRNSSLPDYPIRVFFPCTGLGRQQRGFETFTQECATALADDPRVDITVFAGGRVPSMPVTALRNLPRDSRAAKWVARTIGRDAYFVEQFSFFLSFLPYLTDDAAHVVYFADLNLGNLCWHWRRRTKQEYRLVYYNGGLTTKPFTRADLVQQVTPEGFREAVARGEEATRQIVLPHGVQVSPVLPPRIIGEARLPLGLPATRPVVLSVGMLDMQIKRMDYVIREVASLPPPRPFVALLGAETSETPGIRSLARELLGADGALIRTVPKSEIGAYYRAADTFVLASLREGFGLAYVEASAHGLPVVAHDFGVTRYLLDGVATLADLTQAGVLARALVANSTTNTEPARSARHAAMYNRFSWDVLHDDYVEMLQRAALLPLEHRS